jgi:addiction module HigA family antidote
MATHNPLHPGEILKEVYLEPLGLSITEVAQKLAVTRNTLSQILNGHRGISIEMALRLSKAFNTSEQLWLGMQQDYDLWQAKQKTDLAQVQIIYPSREIAREA